MPPTPESAGRWLSTIMPVLERGGPVVALLALLIGGGTVWYLLGVLDRAVQRNHVLVERLLTEQERHRAELLRYVHCPPQP